MRPEIPDGLAERIDAVVESDLYNSKTEFVCDAIRRRLEELDQM